MEVVATTAEVAIAVVDVVEVIVDVCGVTTASGLPRNSQETFVFAFATRASSIMVFLLLIIFLLLTLSVLFLLVVLLLLLLMLLSSLFLSLEHLPKRLLFKLLFDWLVEKDL